MKEAKNHVTMNIKNEKKGKNKKPKTTLFCFITIGNILIILCSN